jgi:hypothetical protein
MSVRVGIWLCSAALTLVSVGCVCCRECKEDGERRAGYPSRVSCLAQPSDTGAYDGYYVGGGTPCRGEGPREEEGTWGWDYLGRWWNSRVALLWSHGREQGGSGAYKTDGPQVLHHDKKGEE